MLLLEFISCFWDTPEIVTPPSNNNVEILSISPSESGNGSGNTTTGNDKTSGRKSPTACERLTKNVIDLHAQQSIGHPVTVVTEKDETENRTRVAVAAGGVYPVIGDVRVSGCVSFPSPKEKK